MASSAVVYFHQLNHHFLKVGVVTHPPIFSAWPNFLGKPWQPRHHFDLNDVNISRIYELHPSDHHWQRPPFVTTSELSSHGSLLYSSEAVLPPLKSTYTGYWAH